MDIGSPTITVVNTIGLDTGIHDSTATWKTCSDSPCTEAPHTGACSAVSSSNDKLGVVCQALHTQATCASPLTWTARTLSHEYGNSTDMVCNDRSQLTEETCGACDKGTCSDATRQPDDCLYNFVQNTDLASALANTVDLTITEQECRDIQAAYDPSATFNVATNANGPRGCVKLASNTNYYYRANGAHSRTDCTTAAAVCSDTSHTTEADCLAAVVVTSGASLAADHAQSLDATECQAYADADDDLTWKLSLSNSYFPMGCSKSGTDVLHNTATSGADCDADPNIHCVQKAGTWTAPTFSPTHVCIKKSGNTVSTLDSSTTCVDTCSNSSYTSEATCGTCSDTNMLSALRHQRIMQRAYGWGHARILWCCHCSYHYHIGEWCNVVCSGWMAMGILMFKCI